MSFFDLLIFLLHLRPSALPARSSLPVSTFPDANLGIVKSLGYRSITKVKVRFGKRINQICFTYSDGSIQQHGQPVGHMESEFQLGRGEQITAVHSKQCKTGLKRIRFYASNGASYSFGKGAGETGWEQYDGTASDPIIDIVCSDLAGLGLGIKNVVRCTLPARVAFISKECAIA